VGRFKDLAWETLSKAVLDIVVHKYGHGILDEAAPLMGKIYALHCDSRINEARYARYARPGVWDTEER
jgi:hypothetical protein